MRRVTQRRLHNESAAIMDAVAAGETVIITRRGVEVAALGPLPRQAEAPTSELKRAVAGLPKIDFAALRAEADALFGTDRIGG